MRRRDDADHDRRLRSEPRAKCYVVEHMTEASQTVGVRELRQNLSRHLERVKAGEALVVTERGRVVARLVPAGGPAEPYSELSARFGSSVPTTRLSEVARSLTPPGARAGTTDALLAGGRTERPA